MTEIDICIVERQLFCDDTVIEGDLFRHGSCRSPILCARQFSGRRFCGKIRGNSQFRSRLHHAGQINGKAAKQEHNSKEYCHLSFIHKSIHLAESFNNFGTRFAL